MTLMNLIKQDQAQHIQGHAINCHSTHDMTEPYIMHTGLCKPHAMTVVEHFYNYIKFVQISKAPNEYNCNTTLAKWCSGLSFGCRSWIKSTGSMFFKPVLHAKMTTNWQNFVVNKKNKYKQWKVKISTISPNACLHLMENKWKLVQARKSESLKGCGVEFQQQ